MTARVITFMFLDERADGRVICDEANRTARIWRIPKNLLPACSDRGELRQVGVYLLLGYNERTPEFPYCYVGETESLIQRLTEHMRTFEKFEWKDALVLLAQDSAINKAHAKYIESSWYQKLTSAGRCVLDQAIPAQTSLSEADKAVTDDFALTAEFLVGALGYRLFDTFDRTHKSAETSNLTDSIPIQERQSLQSVLEGANRFVIESKRGNYKATGYPVNEGFLVESGSTINMKVRQSGRDMGIDELRDQLTSSGFLRISNGSAVFLKDWIAPSSSRAASVVCGSSQSGPREWTHERSGKSLGDWQKVQAESLAKALDLPRISGQADRVEALQQAAVTIEWE